MIPNTVVNIIKKNAGKRKISAYGWNEKLSDELRINGVDIEKCFTGNLDLLNRDKDFFCKLSELDGKKDEFYTVILITLLNAPKQQRETMTKFGLEEIKDYVFITLPESITIDKPVQNYRDNYGNTIKNLPSNTTVIFNGWENKVDFGEKINFPGKLRVNIKGCSNEFEIGKGFTVSSNITDLSCNGNNNKLRIKENCTFTNSNSNNHIHLFENGIFRCGKNTVVSGIQATVVKNTFIEIGENCLFSYFIIAQSGDGHSIFDINTGENISSASGKRRGISVGNHVWVGMRSYLLPCSVGDGSVIGAQSVVKGTFPNNCAVAGSPARIVRKNVAWSAVNEASDISACMEYITPTDETHIRKSEKERIKELENRISELEAVVSELKNNKKFGFRRKS